MKAHITGIIDVEAWNSAKWVATAYFIPQYDNAPPAMGLVFEDEPAALRIFDGWRSQLGANDAEGRLRIAVIEGPLPGKEPGYTVHIGPNRTQAIKHISDEETDGGVQHFIFLSRYCRMTPPASSPHLANFKKSLAKYGKYLLVPVSGGLGNPRPIFDRGLELSALTFRTSDQIVGRDDPDFVVLK